MFWNQDAATFNDYIYRRTADALKFFAATFIKYIFGEMQMLWFYEAATLNNNILRRTTDALE